MITKIKDKTISHNEILKKLDFKDFNDKKNEIINGLQNIQKTLDEIGPNLQNKIEEVINGLTNKILIKLMTIIINVTKGTELEKFFKESLLINDVDKEFIN